MMKGLFFLSTSLFFVEINAQQVESKAYNFMLSTLLSHSVPEVSVSDLNASDDIVWLDARSKQEFDVSRIPGAHWVGYDDFSLDRVKDIPKDSKVVVYCSVGYRSEKVAEKLQEDGFFNVQNLYGGIFEWKNQGKSVVDSTGMETPRVHAYNKVWGIWLKKGKKVYE